jgi:hypothetical protein
VLRENNIDLSSVKYGIWYLLASLKKNVTRQTWRALFHFGEYLFQSTHHFGECLKKMVSHTEYDLVDDQNHEILKPAISGFYICFHPV